MKSCLRFLFVFLWLCASGMHGQAKPAAPTNAVPAKPAAEPALAVVKMEPAVKAEPAEAAKPVAAPKAKKKPFTSIKLTPSDSKGAEVSVTPAAGSAIVPKVKKGAKPAEASPAAEASKASAETNAIEAQKKEPQPKKVIKPAPKDGAPVPAVVVAQRGDTFLLDVNGILTNGGRRPAKEELILLVPKKKRGIAVTVEAEEKSYEGMVFRRKGNLYQLDVNNILNARGGYRYRYHAHTFEISQLLGGDSVFSTKFNGSRTYFSGMTVLNIYTENRYKRRNGYSSLVQLRVGYGGMGFYGKPSAGVLFGGSQYVFDRRGFESGKGWSMLVNGGMSFDFSSQLAQNFTSYPAALGAEIEFKAIYNFHKYVGISFGFLMGYSIAPDLSSLFGGGYTGPVDANGFPIYQAGATASTPGLVLDQSFRWGFTVGIIF